MGGPNRGHSNLRDVPNSLAVSGIGDEDVNRPAMSVLHVFAKPNSLLRVGKICMVDCDFQRSSAVTLLW